MPEQTSEADSQRHELEVRGRSSGCPANEAGDTERDKAAKAYELTGRLAERSRQEVGHSISWVLCVGCGLTPAHDLRGAARSGNLPYAGGPCQPGTSGRPRHDWSMRWLASVT